MHGFFSSLLFANPVKSGRGSQASSHGPALLVYENNGDRSHILGLFGHFIRPYLYKGDQNCGLSAAHHH